MSFKDNLEKILAIFGEQIDPQGWMDGDIDQALTSIINLVDKEIIDVENRTRAKCAAEMAFLDQEITKLKAEIEQLKS